MTLDSEIVRYCISLVKDSDTKADPKKAIKEVSKKIQQRFPDFRESTCNILAETAVMARIRGFWE